MGTAWRATSVSNGSAGALCCELTAGPMSSEASLAAEADRRSRRRAQHPNRRLDETLCSLQIHRGAGTWRPLTPVAPIREHARGNETLKVADLTSPASKPRTTNRLDKGEHRADPWAVAGYRIPAATASALHHTTRGPALSPASREAHRCYPPTVAKLHQAAREEYSREIGRSLAALEASCPAPKRPFSVLARWSCCVERLEEVWPCLLSKCCYSSIGCRLDSNARRGDGRKSKPSRAVRHEIDRSERREATRKCNVGQWDACESGTASHLPACAVKTCAFPACAATSPFLGSSAIPGLAFTPSRGHYNAGGVSSQPADCSSCAHEHLYTSLAPLGPSRPSPWPLHPAIELVPKIDASSSTVRVTPAAAKRSRTCSGVRSACQRAGTAQRVQSESRADLGVAARGDHPRSVGAFDLVAVVCTRD